MQTPCTIIYRPDGIDDFLVEHCMLDVSKPIEDCLRQAMEQSEVLDASKEDIDEMIKEPYDLIAIIRGHCEFIY